MRQDAYPSVWRWVAIGLVVIILLGLIAWGMMMVGRHGSSEQPLPTSPPAVTSEPPAAEPANEPENDPELVAAILAFVEAYNLPASDSRNKLLSDMSTAEGYDMVYRDPNIMSDIERAAANRVRIEALSDGTSIQVEPLDETLNVVSAHIIPTVRIIRDGVVLNTLELPGMTTSWVKEDDTWKMAFIQF